MATRSTMLARDAVRATVEPSHPPLRSARAAHSAQPMWEIAAPASAAAIPAFNRPERRTPSLYPSPRLALQCKLAIGAVDDPLEREADAMAKSVTSASPLADAGTDRGGPAMRRKCACGGSGEPCEACEDPGKSLLQRRAASAVAPIEAPPIVHHVLGSPGRPLDAAARAFFEPRFRRDFSQVRVHTGAQAADSAAAVDAKAFTVGRNIVFGANQYAPDSGGGRELLAHELAHTVQQSQPAANAVVRRACLPAAECAAPIQGAQDTFVAQTEALPANVSKAKRRAALCGASPVDPRCTADGHGRPAVELEKFLAAQLPARAPAIKGIYVDMDIPAQYGAYTNPCLSFTPPVAAGADEQCTFVPNELEREAGLYNSGASQIAGRDRRTWSQVAARTLTHETEHGFFARSPNETKLKSNPCDFDSISSSLTELAAIISEFRPVYLKSLALATAAREAELRGWFRFWIKSRGESISGSVKDIRCKCDCGAANDYIKNTFRFATKDWNDYQRWLYNKTLQAAEWALNWPVDPPPSVPVEELPSAIPVVEIEDLPHA